jgi:hypothetical protein
VERLASNHLCQQALDALSDPFQALSLSRTRGEVWLRRPLPCDGGVEGFLVMQDAAIHASLLAMAVASLLRCILRAAFRSHVPELKRSQLCGRIRMTLRPGARRQVCIPLRRQSAIPAFS